MHPSEETTFETLGPEIWTPKIFTKKRRLRTSVSPLSGYANGTTNKPQASGNSLTNTKSIENMLVVASKILKLATSVVSPPPLNITKSIFRTETITPTEPSVSHKTITIKEDPLVISILNQASEIYNKATAKVHIETNIDISFGSTYVPSTSAATESSFLSSTETEMVGLATFQTTAKVFEATNATETTIGVTPEQLISPVISTSAKTVEPAEKSTLEGGTEERVTTSTFEEISTLEGIKKTRLLTEVNHVMENKSLGTTEPEKVSTESTIFSAATHSEPASELTQQNKETTVSSETSPENVTERVENKTQGRGEGTKNASGHSTTSVKEPQVQSTENDLSITEAPESTMAQTTNSGGITAENTEASEAEEHSVVTEEQTETSKVTESNNITSEGSSGKIETTEATSGLATLQTFEVVTPETQSSEHTTNNASSENIGAAETKADNEVIGSSRAYTENQVLITTSNEGEQTTEQKEETPTSKEFSMEASPSTVTSTQDASLATDKDGNLEITTIISNMNQTDHEIPEGMSETVGEQDMSSEEANVTNSRGGKPIATTLSEHQEEATTKSEEELPAGNDGASQQSQVEEHSTSSSEPENINSPEAETQMTSISASSTPSTTLGNTLYHSSIVANKEAIRGTETSINTEFLSASQQSIEISLKKTVSVPELSSIHEEVFEENEIDHFSHHESSTLCENCEEQSTSKLPTNEKLTTSNVVGSHLPSSEQEEIVSAKSTSTEATERTESPSITTISSQNSLAASESQLQSTVSAGQPELPSLLVTESTTISAPTEQEVSAAATTATSPSDLQTSPTAISNFASSLEEAETRLQSTATSTSTVLAEASERGYQSESPEASALSAAPKSESTTVPAPNKKQEEVSLSPTTAYVSSELESSPIFITSTASSLEGSESQLQSTGTTSVAVQTAEGSSQSMLPKASSLSTTAASESTSLLVSSEQSGEGISATTVPTAASQLETSSLLASFSLSSEGSETQSSALSIETSKEQAQTELVEASSFSLITNTESTVSALTEKQEEVTHAILNTPNHPLSSGSVGGSEVSGVTKQTEEIETSSSSNPISEVSAEADKQQSTTEENQATTTSGQSTTINGTTAEGAGLVATTLQRTHIEQELAVSLLSESYSSTTSSDISKGGNENVEQTSLSSDRSSTGSMEVALSLTSTLSNSETETQFHSKHTISERPESSTSYEVVSEDFLGHLSHNQTALENKDENSASTSASAVIFSSSSTLGNTNLMVLPNTFEPQLHSSAGISSMAGISTEENASPSGSSEPKVSIENYSSIQPGTTLVLTSASVENRQSMTTETYSEVHSKHTLSQKPEVNVTEEALDEDLLGDFSPKNTPHKNGTSISQEIVSQSSLSPGSLLGSTNVVSEPSVTPEKQQHSLAETIVSTSEESTTKSTALPEGLQSELLGSVSEKPSSLPSEQFASASVTLASTTPQSATGEGQAEESTKYVVTQKPEVMVTAERVDEGVIGHFSTKVMPHTNESVEENESSFSHEYATSAASSLELGISNMLTESAKTETKNLNSVEMPASTSEATAEESSKSSTSAIEYSSSLSVATDENVSPTALLQDMTTEDRSIDHFKHTVSEKPLLNVTSEAVDEDGHFSEKATQSSAESESENQTSFKHESGTTTISSLELGSTNMITGSAQFSEKLVSNSVQMSASPGSSIASNQESKPSTSVIERLSSIPFVTKEIFSSTSTPTVSTPFQSMTSEVSSEEQSKHIVSEQPFLNVTAEAIDEDMIGHFSGNIITSIGEGGSGNQAFGNPKSATDTTSTFGQTFVTLSSHGSETKQLYFPDVLTSLQEKSTEEATGSSQSVGPKDLTSSKETYSSLSPKTHLPSFESSLLSTTYGQGKTSNLGQFTQTTQKLESNQTEVFDENLEPFSHKEITSLLSTDNNRQRSDASKNLETATSLITNFGLGNINSVTEALSLNGVSFSKLEGTITSNSQPEEKSSVSELVVETSSSFLPTSMDVLTSEGSQKATTTSNLEQNSESSINQESIPAAPTNVEQKLDFSEMVFTSTESALVEGTSSSTVSSSAKTPEQISSSSTEEHRVETSERFLETPSALNVISSLIPESESVTSKYASEDHFSPSTTIKPSDGTPMPSQSSSTLEELMSMLTSTAVISSFSESATDAKGSTLVSLPGSVQMENVQDLTAGYSSKPTFVGLPSSASLHSQQEEELPKTSLEILNLQATTVRPTPEIAPPSIQKEYDIASTSVLPTKPIEAIPVSSPEITSQKVLTSAEVSKSASVSLPTGTSSQGGVATGPSSKHSKVSATPKADYTVHEEALEVDLEHFSHPESLTLCESCEEEKGTVNGTEVVKPSTSEGYTSRSTVAKPSGVGELSSELSSTQSSFSSDVITSVPPSTALSESESVKSSTSFHLPGSAEAENVSPFATEKPIEVLSESVQMFSESTAQKVFTSSEKNKSLSTGTSSQGKLASTDFAPSVEHPKATPKFDYTIHEEALEINLEHFSHLESSTLCESCEEGKDKGTKMVKGSEASKLPGLGERSSEVPPQSSLSLENSSTLEVSTATHLFLASGTPSSSLTVEETLTMKSSKSLSLAGSTEGKNLQALTTGQPSSGSFSGNSLYSSEEVLFKSSPVNILQEATTEHSMLGLNRNETKEVTSQIIPQNSQQENEILTSSSVSQVKVQPELSGTSSENPSQNVFPSSEVSESGTGSVPTGASSQGKINATEFAPSAEHPKISATPKSDYTVHQEVLEVDLEHFSHRESSTLCENCEEGTRTGIKMSGLQSSSEDEDTSPIAHSTNGRRILSESEIAEEEITIKAQVSSTKAESPLPLQENGGTLTSSSSGEGTRYSRDITPTASSPQIMEGSFGTAPAVSSTLDVLGNNKSTENVTLTSTEIHIDLPIFLPNSSETPENFLKYYTTAMQTVIIDDEATDFTIGEHFRDMNEKDFEPITEHPVTIAGGEDEPSSRRSTTEVANKPSNQHLSQLTKSLKETTEHTNILSSQRTTSTKSKNTSVTLTSQMPVNPTTSTVRSSGSEPNVQSDQQRDVILNACNASDFQSGKGCFCVIDQVLNELKAAAKKKNRSHEMDAIKCERFFRIKEGVLLRNETVTETRVKRSYNFMKEQRMLKREIVANKDIDHTLMETSHIHSTDSKIYAVPGSKVTIPCIGGEIAETSKTDKYSWTMSGERPLTEGKVQEKGGILIIENVTPQDGGNYTCKVITSTNEEGRSVSRQLVIISMPKYSVNAHVVYNMTESCNLTDVDVMSSYLPLSLKELLCGFKCKYCDVKVEKPHCIRMGEKGFMSLHIMVSLEPLKAFFPLLIPSTCDINCQMQIYAKVAGVLVKNVENIETVPVISKLKLRKAKLFPLQISRKQQNGETEITQPPKLVISCPAGFGLHKPEKVCAACEPNTFSAGDESYCTPCSVGEYQPVSGSKSCLICTSPLQDAACLKIMYSNTKMFRVYVGVGFGTLVLIMVLVICCTTAAKKSEKSTAMATERHRRPYKSEFSKARRSRNLDVEQAIEPLLSEGQRRSRRQSLQPPKPPPPDF